MLITSHQGLEFECFVGSNFNLKILESAIQSATIRNVTLHVEQNLVERFYRADLFLRLNREDAYGVSIQEALDCGVQALASDVCQRPAGAMLFSNGDWRDLKLQFENLIGAFDTLDFADRQSTDYHTQLVELYKDLLQQPV